MHDAVLPFLNLAILGSFMAMSVIDAKQTDRTRDNTGPGDTSRDS